jgi:signal transduction histidine kinase
MSKRCNRNEIGKKMKRKIYLIMILFLSGWIFSGIEYLIFKNEKKKPNEEITKKEEEITKYKNLIGEVEKAKDEIDNIVNTLNNLKLKLEKLENEVKKGE